jgi:hypothetical protein
VTLGRHNRFSSKRIVFSASLAVLALILGELLLRILTALSPAIDDVLSPAPVSPAIPDAELAWRGNPAYPGHDRQGFRNASIPEMLFLVALGDSQTYGVSVRADDAWPHQLELLIGQPVYSMAFGGWGPVQSLLQFGQAVDMKPTVIIESFYSGNDSFDSFMSVYGSANLQDLKTSDNELARAIYERQRSDPWSQVAISEGATPTAHRRIESLKLISLFGAIGRVFGVGRLETSYPVMSDSARGIHFTTGSITTQLDPGRLRGLDLRDPRIQEGLQISLKAIQRMDLAAKVAGVKFVVLCMPTKELVLKDAVFQQWRDVPSRYRLEIENEERLWQATREFLNSRAIRYLEALPALSELVDRGEQPYFESIDGHLNPLGHRRIAQLVRDARD